MGLCGRVDVMGLLGPWGKVMSDDVELYRSKQTEVDIVYDLSYAYLVLDDIKGECGIMPLDAAKARQIGLRLVKWADEQKEDESFTYSPIQLERHKKLDAIFNDMTDEDWQQFLKDHPIP